MKGFTVLSAAVLATVALTSTAFAQRAVPTPSLTEESVRTITVTGRPTVHRIDLRGDFRPAGSTPDPYVHLQTMFARWNDSGAYGLSFSSFTGGRTIGDDVVLMSSTPDPGTLGYNTTTPVACISEITFALLSTDAVGGTLELQLNIHPWNGLFGSTAGASIASGTISLTIPPVTGFGLFLITVPVNPSLPAPNAFWVAFTPTANSTINLANVGLLIANSTPGSVSMLPGRGYFRATTATNPVFTALTGGSVFTGLPQGSFYLAIRGTHNFVGTVDMSALSSRARPSDPLAFEFDDDPVGDPDEGIEEALRRNIVDVEVVNDSGPTPFTSRFSTYLDENGRFTLPVSGSIASIKVRRWDNGLAVAFSRPVSGWSTDFCDPTVDTQSMVFGDVNGDGTIDDGDLLTVLFGFGSSE